MPKIPLYRDRIAEQPLAAGSLGPRADVGAFTAPGRAMAGFGKAASDIAFQFGQAEKKAETERVYAEALSEESDRFTEFTRTQPARTVDGFQIVARNFKDTALSKIDGMSLTKSQKETIKLNLGKNLDIKIASAESQIFNQQQTDRQKAMQKGIDALIGDAADKNLRPNILADIRYMIDFAKDNGFDTGYTMRSVQMELDNKDFLTDTADESKGLPYFQSMLDDARQGRGKYADYSASEQEASISDIEGHITYLETGAIAQAKQDAETAKNNIRFTGKAGEEGAKAVNGYRMAGQDAAANELEMQFTVAEDVYAGMSSVAFKSDAEIKSFVGLQRELADELVSQGKSTEAAARLDAVRQAVANRQAAITEDPADYVTKTYRQIYKRDATPAQIVQAQKDMGIAERDIKPLTGKQATEITSKLSAAQTPQEVQNILAPVVGSGELTPYIMRQLSGSGMRLSHQYIANNPKTPTSSLLLEATKPDAIKISVSPTAKDNVRSIVTQNETVKQHLNSMLGGSYADFNNNQIMGSVSNTVAMSKAREQHIDMISQATIYLIQQDGKTLSKEAGIAVEQSEIKSYVEQAASILSERFAYVGGFENSAVTLRIPAGLGGNASIIRDNLTKRVESLTTNDVFYADNQFTPGMREFQVSQDVYLDRVKGEFGWIIDNDGVNAMLVDGYGGLVFGPNKEPITENIFDMSVEAEDSQRLVDEPSAFEPTG